MTASPAAPSFIRPRANRDLIRSFWQQHTRVGEVYEVRIPKPKRSGPRRFASVMAGYFDNCDAFVSAVSEVSGDDAAGVYASLNPLLPDLLARGYNRLAPADITAVDCEVSVLRRLLIDVDACHPRGVCSTEDEREAALVLRDEIRCLLSDELHWPEPEKEIATGNGAALHYLLADLDNSLASISLLRSCLEALAALFNQENALAKVDPTTFNPSRLSRIAGTVNALGDGIPVRPWRLVTAAYASDAVAIDRHQLNALAALAPQILAAPQVENGDRGTSSAPHLNIRQILVDAGIGFQERPLAKGIALRLDRCLTSTQHTDGAAIIEFASGALTYRCHHASCSSKGWLEAKHALHLPLTNVPDYGRTNRSARFRGFEYRHGEVIER